MNKNKLLLLVLLLVVFVTGCSNNSNNDIKTSIGLKFNGLDVDTIDVYSENTKFSVVASSVNENFNYDIVLVTENDEIDNSVSFGLVELSNDGEATDMSINFFTSKEITLYHGSVQSGEVAYGKSFELKISKDEIVDKYNFKIKIVKK